VLGADSHSLALHSAPHFPDKETEARDIKQQGSSEGVTYTVTVPVGTGGPGRWQRLETYGAVKTQAVRTPW
jgi:hypothetical protein